MALEMEASLAKKPGVYLVLDPARRVLEVKSRATVLDSVLLRGVQIVHQQKFLAARQGISPPVPATWTVEQGPAVTREVIAPAELRMPSNDEEDESAEATPAPTPAIPKPTPTPKSEPPTSYRAKLDNGWDIWVVENLPPQSWLGLFFASVRDGWVRLRGEGQNLRPAVTLAMAAEDAQRIHHLLQSGMPILVTAAE